MFKLKIVNKKYVDSMVDRNLIIYFEDKDGFYWFKRYFKNKTMFYMNNENCVEPIKSLYNLSFNYLI